MARDAGPNARSPLADTPALVASGLLLAVHFGAWTWSLGEISVARSVLLVSTHPVFTAFGERFVLGRALGMRTLLGAGLSVLGAATMVFLSGADGTGRSSLFGDALAILGAVSISAYFLLGRRLRARLGLLDYAVPMYGVTALALLVGALSFGQWGLPGGFLPWAALVGLAVFPTILGHLVMSWAIRHLPATAISTSFLGEAIGAALLAWAFLGQVPGRSTLLGGFFLLAGIGLVLARSAPPSPPSPAD